MGYACFDLIDSIRVYLLMEVSKSVKRVLNSYHIVIDANELQGIEDGIFLRGQLLMTFDLHRQVEWWIVFTLKMHRKYT